MARDGLPWVFVVAALLVLGGGAVVVAANLPRGLRNNNPGNILKTAPGASRWQGEQDSADARFARFDSMENGVRALARLLTVYQSRYGLRTVRAMVTRWAPPTENNTAAYVAAVAAKVGVSPDAPVTLDAPTLARMVRAIAEHENGAAVVALHLADAEIAEGVRRALA